MIFDIVGMIFDVIAQMFLFVFGIPLGSGVTYGGVIIVSSLVFGIATVVLNQFLDSNKPVQEKPVISSNPTPRSQKQVKHGLDHWAMVEKQNSRTFHD
jgi:hypothetical protein